MTHLQYLFICTVLDIKPYIPMYDNPALRGDGDSKGGDDNNPEPAAETRVPDWLDSASRNKLTVAFTARAEQDLLKFIGKDEEGNDCDEKERTRLRDLKGPKELRRAIVDILSADPR